MRHLLWVWLLISCAPSHIEPTTTKAATVTQAQPDESIQGTWEVQIPGGPMGGAYIRWKFEEGTYSISGYPALSGAGRYKISRTDGTNLTLELFEQTGDLSQFQTVEIAIDQSTQTLTLRGQGPYKKITP